MTKKPKVVKYIENKQKGFSKRKSALMAGYSQSTADKGLANIERTDLYQRMEEKLSFKDEYLRKVTKEQLVDEQLKVVFQDRDNSSKLTAIRDAMKTIEPESQMEDNEKVVIVLKE